MNLKLFIFIHLILVILLSCNHSNPEISVMNKTNEINAWFENGSWRNELIIKPDSTVDISKFYAHYHKEPVLWEKAFEYLKKKDLKNIEKGKYELVKDSLYIIIDEYNTKNIEDTRYETHIKFADIQYLIRGEEKMGVNKLQAETIVVPYDDENDIAFYEMKEDNFRIANQDNFFIFFPSDAHRPCVRNGNGENLDVKKLVVKIRVN